MAEIEPGDEEKQAIASTGTILPETTKQIRKQVDALKQAYRRTVEQAWELGKTLRDVKASVRHGAWLPWLGKIDLEPRTAQRCMELYDGFPEKRRVSHFGSIAQALRQLSSQSVIDADFTAKGAPGASGADASGGDPASTTSAEEPGADRSVEPERNAVVASASGDGREGEETQPLLPRVAGEVDGDSGPSDDRVATSHWRHSDVGATIASSPGVGKYDDTVRLFVEEVGGAVDRVAAVIERSGVSVSENCRSMDIASASSVIRDVLSLVERRIDHTQKDDLLVELQPRLRVLLEGGANPEGSGPDDVETSEVRTKRSPAPSATPSRPARADRDPGKRIEEA